MMRARIKQFLVGRLAASWVAIRRTPWITWITWAVLRPFLKGA